MIRAMEWDDPRARYPNIWFDGMPRLILAFERVVSRLRLGDLVAVYYPASQRHPERAERFAGISRVAGLRRADQTGYGWIDLETAHKFNEPLALDQQPRRVFLCCDPGWPGPEVDLFKKVFDAAVAEGWEPREDELQPEAAPTIPAAAPESETAFEIVAEEPETNEQPIGRDEGESAAPVDVPTPEPVARQPEAEEAIDPGEPVRMFAGVDYSGDMRDPRDRTWLAVTELRGDRLRVTRLEATGRNGLQSYLRDPGRMLMAVEAIGLDFPFGLPTPFAERVLGSSFPEQGWWALVRKLEKMTRPEYLVAVQEFREAEGELKRLTDERADSLSPLHRVDPDLGTRTFHGMRMIAEDRSRFAIRPFESAQGKLLLEVFPSGTLRRMGLAKTGGDGETDSRKLLGALRELDHLPVDLDEQRIRVCSASSDALQAVISARCAAVAVLSGETEKGPDDLAPGEGERVRREGWIYGLGESD
jgi:hypothetical protein